MYRGEMPAGKDRQAPVEDPYPQSGYGFSSLLSEQDGPVWIGWTLATPVVQQEHKMGRRFTVLDNFKSDETQSEYVAGMSYESQDGDKVSKLIDKWIKDGKVREGGPVSEVSGSDAPESKE